MNKNPFLPTPSFTPQQPPLPPGPPPPQPSQPDYSAWWANAAAQPHVQPPTVGPYNTQWTPPQPPRPPAEQSALYANYGYGSQNNHWQRQQQQHQQHQQQQQQQYHPPPPAIQQPPQPPTQPAYNPYQPSAGYPQQYVPQPGPPPQPMVHPSYPHPPAQPQHFFPPPIPSQPPQQQHHQQTQQTQPRHIHHTPPQHLPPAKRQRFDGPNNNNRHHQNQPPQPQFQPPPAPPQNLGNFSGPSHGPTRGGVPSGPAGRGGGPAGPRGGSVGARGARGGSMSGNRGGLSGGRGRGGSFVGGGGGGRGGSGGGQSNGPLRGHGSRNNFGGGNKDFHNRRGGGSFTSSGGGTGYSHQGGSSFRGRNQGHMSSNRNNRPDGGSGPVFGSREGTMSSSFGGKKDENRRTLTDFKIIGLAIPGLTWTWGIIPSLSPVMVEGHAINADGQGASSAVVKEDILDDSSSMHGVASSSTAKETQTEVKSEVPFQSTEIDMVDAKPLQDTMSNARVSSDNAPPPSRIRFYFHTPVTADDSRPIPHNSTYGDIPSDSRKGKRKKLEDDDGDLEERRAPPPPPQMSSAMNDDQLSVTASVAETASEGDWLMAAIVEGEEAGGVGGDLPSEDDEDSDQLHVSQIVKDHEHDDSIDDDVTVGDIETFVDGNSHDDVHMTGAELDALASSAAFGTMDDNPKVAEAATENALFAISSGQMSTPGHTNGGHTTDPNAAADNSEQPEAVASDNIVAILPLAPDGHDSSVSASLISFSSQNEVTSAESADDYSADHPEYLETQVFDASSQKLTSKSFGTVSADPTLLNMEPTQPDENVSNNLNGIESYDNQTTNDVNGAAGAISHEDHLPEPPASPSDDASSLPLVKVDAGMVKTPSANRLSISYSRGNRRFVVDAEVVESVKIFRQEGRIEVTISIDKNVDGSLKGILMEGLSDVTKSYLPLLTDSDASSAPDTTVPPFSKVPVPSALKLFVYLDTARPLSEPKWAKTGDVQDWLKSMFGRMFWVAGDAAEGWEKKIHVVDPDPPPTIWTVLDGWSTNSPVGVMNERQRFLKTHMTETDNILEILLRLVRGERATPFSQSTPAISAPSVSGPLLSALSQGSAHGAQQTHVSLAVLAMFRLTVDYAKKALGDKGKGDAEERMGEIIRCLPSHLIYKSLDGIFKEWRVEKKGR